jgi:hypothetical protein
MLQFQMMKDLVSRWGSGVLELAKRTPEQTVPIPLSSLATIVRGVGEANKAVLAFGIVEQLSEKHCMGFPMADDSRTCISERKKYCLVCQAKRAL